MYGQSCRVVGHRGVGSPAVRWGLPLLGAQHDLPQPPVRGDPPGPLGPLCKAIHRPTKALVAATDEEQRVQGLAFPTCPRGGSCPARPPWCTCRGLACAGGGGVVGGEEGVGAVHHPVASLCVVWVVERV